MAMKRKLIPYAGFELIRKGRPPRLRSNYKRAIPGDIQNIILNEISWINQEIVLLETKKVGLLQRLKQIQEERLHEEVDQRSS